MAKSLELHFLSEEGKTVRLSLDDPIEPVDELAVKQVMDTIIANNVFQSSSGAYKTAKAARLLERNVTEFPLE
ncbi:DUF2922 domain-containing protein [Bacillus spongiae]|uniref:DUF2922 domain-containing protein n=1 Tax=Bacillus spongiae TaxID=2683610 RepID=A0ABU8HBM5_9BACI